MKVSTSCIWVFLSVASASFQDNDASSLERSLAACPAKSIADSSGAYCCPATCGQCGGAGCDKKPGGVANCCTSQIKTSCTVKGSPPCIAGAAPAPAPTGKCPAGSVADPTGKVCCPGTCGTCGGTGCDKRPGGTTSCCTSKITRSCATNAAPCAVSGAAPAPAPTPTGGPVVVGTNTCSQPVAPPGVKPGSCMEVVCMPKSVAPGKLFHTTVRWCLQRPRKYYATINLLDINSKEYFTGTGLTPPGEYQCAEHTFALVFDAKTTPNSNPAKYDIMWKWFITPIWGSAANGSLYNEPFPNMLAETGIAKQPAYGALIGDCPVVPDRFWNLAPTGKQDAIDFEILPKCITPGVAWSIQVKSHLESRATADLHVNIMIGTGGDLYLGPDDIYVTESNKYGLAKNAATQYWTASTLAFTGAQTAKLTKTSRVYISAFLTPAGQVYGAVATGFTYLDHEYMLNAKIC